MLRAAQRAVISIEARTRARIRRILRALIERHDDVRAQPDLRRHRTLRAEKMRRAIQVRPKRHAFLVDLAQFAQAEYLESAGIGEDAPDPTT